MASIHSFPPIESSTARILILGTMPGSDSLREREYYAHGRNKFWNILSDTLGFDCSLSYEARKSYLVNAGIAVWDVLECCTRESSLDSDIDESSVVPNDFTKFLVEHPCIARVFFNGATAESLYRKYVLPTLRASPNIAYARLPSTSPAHASVPYQEKVRKWRVVVE